MVSIAIRFLAGRYHATGWDHHVNEGVPEWPPAPFRLLRALVAASTKLDPRPSDEALGSLLSALTAPPAYQLPAAAQAHTRHYMPIPGKTTKIFDAFIAVGDGAGQRGEEIVVQWPGVELSAPQRDLLARMLDALGYLGRAESWVECRLMESDSARCNTHRLDESQSADHESRLLACETSERYLAWRDGFLAAQPKKSKLTLPATLLDVLRTDTGALHKQGWSSAPGTRWVRYGFDSDPFRRMPRTRTVRSSTAPPSVARYAIASNVLPRFTEAVALGERMRQALLAHSRDASDISHSIFLGRDEHGAPLTGARHAYFLPEDADHDGFIDHILVCARHGFDSRAVAALRSVTRLWGRDGHELWLTLLALGQPTDRGLTSSATARDGSAALGPARVWRSATPFVPARHAKRRRGEWIDLPDDQLRRELGFLDLAPTRISPLDSARDGAAPWYRFRRRRVLGGGGARGTDHGFGFEIEFATPVCGPIAVGYGAHFGLGRFEASG